MKALVLLSGGQDSATCLFWAKAHYNQVEAISFSYNQRHSNELEMAEELARIADVPWQCVPVEMPVVSGLITGQFVEGVHPISKHLPASFVPGRNALFLLLASIEAYHRDSQALIIGVSSIDFSGYPDCRPDFINSMEKTISLALDKPIKIEAPLLFLSKEKTWQLAEDLGILNIIIENTLTCYEGTIKKHAWGFGCGKCPSCKIRKKSFINYIKNSSLFSSI